MLYFKYVLGSLNWQVILSPVPLSLILNHHRICLANPRPCANASILCLASAVAIWSAMSKQPISNFTWKPTKYVCHILIKSSNVVPVCRWVANLLVRYRLMLCSSMLKVNQKRPDTIEVKDPQLSLQRPHDYNINYTRAHVHWDI